MLATTTTSNVCIFLFVGNYWRVADDVVLLLVKEEVKVWSVTLLDGLRCHLYRGSSGSRSLSVRWDPLK